MTKDWRHSASIYHILPRSFCDSKGTGNGDIKGIISKIDYLKNLGVEAVLLHSIFLSPKKNLSEDVANHLQIDFDFGTLDELVLLIDLLHKENIKLLLDFPVNHTSHLHPWFDKSKNDISHPKRDWYIWKKGKNGKAPNRWKSLLNKKCWHYNKAMDDYYFYSTFPFQPDLNYHNEDLQNYMLQALEFYLKLGVDGFKFSLGFNLNKNFDQNKNPFKWNLMNQNGKLPYAKNGNVTLEQSAFHQKVENLLLQYENRLLIEDKAGNIDEVMASNNQSNIHHIIYNEFSKLKFSAKNYASFIKSIEVNYHSKKVPAYMASSIHLQRMFTKVGEQDDVATLIASLQFIMRGVAYIYYGEEIGLRNIQPKIKYCYDPYLKFNGDEAPNNKNFLSRDASWLPMLWDYTGHSGFTPLASVKPWLAVSKNYRQENVQAKDLNKRSLYHIYKKLFHLKANDNVLQYGNMMLANEELLSKNILSFTRNYNQQKVTVLANFNKEKTSTGLTVKHHELIFSNVPGVNNYRSDQSVLELLPYQLNLYKENFD